MSRPLALLLASAVSVCAQSAPPAPAEKPAASPTPPRVVSPATAELLKTALPKSAFAKPPETRAAADSPDRREIDHPQNTIVRLPQYVVREPKAPVLREQDILTPQAFARRLAQRYYSEGYLAFSKLVGYTPLALVLPSAEASAMAQFHDEERLRQKLEFEDLTNMVMRTDPAAGARAREIGRETFLHWSDMGWQGGSPK